MALTSGTKLGPYEIVAPLGAGGMGEVYRARDTRLGRDVAIKILPQHLSVAPDSKPRFEREAKAISALSHPHICHLYDIGSQDGTDYLVMELLEGETLAQRLQRGALPFNDSLRIGVEVAEALEVAHRAGIVHRDLKPANIMLTKSGAKLMDFGLAKGLAAPGAAAGADVGNVSAPLLSAAKTTSGPSPGSRLTIAGTIVGTIQYMSPEQIEGKDADGRSDIFALGAVLYEMATGRRAFEGKSQLSVASAILEKDPEAISAVQPLAPSVLDHLIRRALAKNPDERWQSAGDIRGELLWIAETWPTKRKKTREGIAWVLAAVSIAAAAISIAALYFSREVAPAYSIRSFIPAPENASFVFVGDDGGPPALSPDGKNLAFVAADANGAPQIYIRALGSLDARALPETDNAWAPFWSPDGRKIGFFANEKLKVIEVQGGPPFSVADAPNGRGGSWSRDGMIIFAPDFRSGMYRVSALGGTPVAVTHIDESKHTSHRWPYFLPDGKHFLYLAVNHGAPRDQNDGIYYASVDGKENIRLKTAFTNPEYTAGSLLYERDGELVAQSLEPGSGKLMTEEQQVTNGITEDATTWRGVFTVSANGVLAYSGGTHVQSQLGWYDRTGKPLGTVGEKFGALTIAGQQLRLSPSGDRVALSIQGPTTDIWVADVARGSRTRLTFGPTGNSSPVWSPDGKWLAYRTINKDGNALARRPAGGGPEEILLAAQDVSVLPDDWSPDGKYLLYEKGASGTHAELWVSPLFGERKPFQVVPSGAFQSRFARFSPDGRWLVYQSDESGRLEIYVVPFHSSGGKWQVSAAGGFASHWRSDGKELFYLSLNRTLMSVPVAMQRDELRLGTPQPLFRTNSTVNYDVLPGGQKFLMDIVGDQDSKLITLVTNWTAELKK
jgi:eukaryotic-like serine/threonine-protein kinase